VLLMTNVDNINSDQVPYLIEQLMQRGARNVHVVNALTKKGRPEYIFFIDVGEPERESVSRFLASEIGTLGIRCLKTDHSSYKYTIYPINMKLKDDLGESIWEGPVNVKLALDDQGSVLSVRVEYEDLKDVARIFAEEGSGITFYELKQMIETEALSRFRKTKYKVEFDSISD
jgi:uncharacterized protein (DUF111 family)